QYYELEHWRAGLRITPRPQLSLLLGGGGGRHRPLGVATDWSLFGDRAAVDGNLAVEGLSRRTLYAGLQVSWRGLWLQGLQQWHRVSDSPLPDVASAPDGTAWYRHLVLKAAWRQRDPWGDAWVLRGNWHSIDRQAPLEWKTYLGDHGTLRGYEALELVGDGGGWASLDVRWNLDPFGSLRVPLLKSLGLQPITFADWGRVFRRDGPLDDYPGGRGWRADVGVGLGKYLGLGGKLRNVRLFAAKPVGEGARGWPWMYTLALEAW
ncbi:ShlB/FhaC/HecB family hemolysin secretion/activation protein, partial [bacterium]|nr:ShlB/FhaC/HecB family hemolysin secretion/activation protein [bacterium]MBU1676645.1 ShlB/FhaC/HecB family hemolysin secretion/activation protein [bacterium]